MTQLKAFRHYSSTEVAVYYYYGYWHVHDPMGCEWTIQPACKIRREDNDIMDGWLTVPKEPFWNGWYEVVVESLVEGYQRFNQLDELICQPKIKQIGGTD